MAAHRAEDHFSSGEDKDLVHWYRQIIRLCKEHGIKVIGVRYPVRSDYLASAKKLQWQALANKSESTGFDKFLDYSTFFSDTGNFADEDHMSADASRVLVARIRQDLLL